MTTATNFSPVGALGAFSPRSSMHASADANFVIGLHRRGDGLPGYWTTAEEDALSRYFVAHDLPSLAGMDHCRRVVRAFQQRADLRSQISTECSDDQTSLQTPWQHDLHAALQKFARHNGESGVQDDRSHDELLQQCWGNEDAFLVHTMMPPPAATNATHLESSCSGRVDGSLRDTVGIHTLLPSVADASSSTDVGTCLDHTLLPPAVADRNSECDHPVEPKRWCRHVTIAED